MIFTEKHHPVYALAPDADLYNGNPATDVFNLKNYNHITFLLVEGAGGTGTVKVQVEECTSAAGAGNTARAFSYRLMSTVDTWGALTASASTGYTTVAGANKMVAIEIDAAELSDGYNFVRLQLTEVVNDPCDAAVIAILSEPRYATAVPLTGIA
jgi:hypothetical protein